MRLFAAALLLALPFTAAAAQHDPAESNWDRVLRIAPGKSLTVKANGHKTTCSLVVANADSLTCAKGKKPADVYQRSQVTLVQVDHRGKSTLLGLGIGTAGGAVFGAAVGRNGSFVPRGVAAIIFAIPGALIGTVIGATGNFAHTTVYRAP